MIISVKKDKCFAIFDEEEHIIDLNRSFDGYKQGDIIIYGTPFDCTGKFPLQLELGLRTDGSIAFRRWRFIKDSNSYFQCSPSPHDAPPTPEQMEVVNGLWSGRYKWEGLKISIGKSIRDLCPIDLKKEEALIGKKIYLA